jgi:hypothetical protein
MTSGSNPTEDYLISVLARTAKAAVEGSLTDNDRVVLYRLALTAAAEEFYRIESNGGGGVSPEVLLLLQQIALVCEDEVDQRKLLGGMGLTAEDVSDAESQDSRRSIEDDGTVRESEPRPPEADEEVDESIRTGSEGGEEGP